MSGFFYIISDISGSFFSTSLGRFSNICSNVICLNISKSSDKRNNDGIRYTCKLCIKLYSKKYIECNKELLKERDHKYYENKNRYGYYGCKKCSRKKFKLTSIEKYGVDNPKKNEIVKVKGQKTNLERYGDVVPTRTLKVKQKTNETNFEIQIKLESTCSYKIWS